MILTDANYEILTLLRTHKYEDGTLIAAHQKYPIDKTKQLVPITKVCNTHAIRFCSDRWYRSFWKALFNLLSRMKPSRVF